ncbi:hypothetical protein HRI_004770400 [Hibiscus trionum]|uniref:Uncharacterized protein n=1 Tax=Hibiscus trionum TaxID=183268 RepID=A0A9W7JD79_HIBTR|nr:hypothetical protein HRI_004770400 [Hibiscus trionum]
MEPTSQETNTTSQPNRGPSLSALIDAIALQEQSFEQSLANQQLWAKQLADAQEAKIKAAVQQITVDAAEVCEIRLGKNVATPEVKLEEFNSERGTGELEPQLQSPSLQFSRPGSTSLFPHPEPEVHKEHRRYAPGDHASKSDLGNFKPKTRYDHFKDHQRSINYPRVSRSPNDDSDPHHGRSTDSRKRRERRGASPVEGSWKRGRSPSKSKPQRYPYSPRSDRYRHTGYERPVDDSVPRDRRPIDSEKHKERRGASPMERSRKRERSPSKPKPHAYGHEDTHRAKTYRDGNNRRHARSIDSRRYREKRGASPSETGKSNKSRHTLAEDRNAGHGKDYGVEIGEPTDRKSECRRTMDASSRNRTTSETLNA